MGREGGRTPLCKVRRRRWISRNTVGVSDIPPQEVCKNSSLELQLDVSIPISVPLKFMLFLQVSDIVTIYFGEDTRVVQASRPLQQSTVFNRCWKRKQTIRHHRSINHEHLFTLSTQSVTSDLPPNPSQNHPRTIVKGLTKMLSLCIFTVLEGCVYNGRRTPLRVTRLN